MTGVGGDELRALSALRFDWALTPDDVWAPFPDHVSELHAQVARNVLTGVSEAKRMQTGSPIGLVVRGEKGSGKTHLLGWVREQAQHEGGYFFLVGLAGGDTFWDNVVQSMLEGLWRDSGQHGTQLHLLLQRLGAKAGASRALQVALSATTASRRGLESFVKGLSGLSGVLGGPETLDTARALVLYASSDPEAQDIAQNFFLPTPGSDQEARSAWGIRSQRPVHLIVRDLSRLLALTGQTVIAIDQIDALIARASMSARTVDSSRVDEGRDDLVAHVAEGIMALRELTRRTLLVVACLPNSWTLIEAGALDSARDRFRKTPQLRTIRTSQIGQALVEKRFTTQFAEMGFVPPYPTWPIAVAAFQDAPDFTPRGLLRRIDAHIESCLERGSVAELHRLVEVEVEVGVPEPDLAAGVDPATDPDLLRLDARFENLKASADVADVFDPKAEDEVVPELLAGGLTAWIEERGGPQSGFSQDPAPGAKPTVHARLRQTLDESVEEEIHWAFRGICSPNARNAQTRVRSAHTGTGIKPGDSTRVLVLVRNTPWPSGVVTRTVVDDFLAAGGIQMPVSDDDLRTFDALGRILAERDPALRRWLAFRRPASNSEFLSTILPPPDESKDHGPSGPVDDSPQTSAVSVVRQSVEPSVELGRVIGTDAPVILGLETLRKHTVIFAGSGSGKTVLVRRLIEECALQGVSSIVLDPNNDLARLGDRWPEPPDTWRPGDDAKAELYLADTDVVVWTPRWQGGRPLSFQPLPDFSSVLNDPDEFRMAVDVAFTALVPRVRAQGRTRKAQEEQAVLRESLEFFARAGSGGLDDLVELMTNLPPQASRIGSAVKMAAAMAQTLTAAMVNDPLFGGTGQSLDPALLLTPAAGKRARVSVVSLIGLPDDEQRQGFVSQLQMALFAWFKKHPSDRPLGGLLVLDEAQTVAPSGAMTVSTQSTLTLASQARKYGLGLVFATQAPKGLHNRVSGNAATQVYGLLNSPSQIDTARDLAKAKGGDIPGISKLGAGEFYLAGEGASFVKMRASMCLSHHPSSALSVDEVLARARVTDS